MLEQNQIDGVLHFQVRKKDTDIRFFYEITSKQPLFRLLEGQSVQAGQIRTLVRGIAYALEQSRCPVSYNGNLFSAADASALMEEIVGQDELSDKGETQKKTKLAALMFGRGAVASPWIFGEMRNLPFSTHLQSFQQFHDRLLTGYAEIMSGDRNTLFKMKERWYYFQCHFPGCEKELKKIKKAQKLSDYRAAVQAMFASGRFVEGGFRNPAS